MSIEDNADAQSRVWAGGVEDHPQLPLSLPQVGGALGYLVNLVRLRPDALATRIRTGSAGWWEQSCLASGLPRPSQGGPAQPQELSLRASLLFCLLRKKLLFASEHAMMDHLRDHGPGDGLYSLCGARVDSLRVYCGSAPAKPGASIASAPYAEWSAAPLRPDAVADPMNVESRRRLALDKQALAKKLAEKQAALRALRPRLAAAEAELDRRRSALAAIEKKAGGGRRGRAGDEGGAAAVERPAKRATRAHQ